MLKGITGDFTGTCDVSVQVSRIPLFCANLGPVQSGVASAIQHL